MRAGTQTFLHTHARPLFALALLLGACAQASPPPGATQDRFSPRVVGTSPEQRAILKGYDKPVVIKFDETLSERGVRPDAMVLVSPETGEVHAQRSGKEVRVTLEGGWQPNRVYHVTVLPGLQDRRGNARAETYELVFSTGPEILSTAVAGLVADRITGKPVVNARVQAVSTDSTVYATVTDTAGFFALQSLPLGQYQAIAFSDLNRNHKLDEREPRDSKSVSVARDTAVYEFALLAPDTTPARLLKADARDSMQVQLSFDDFIAAEEPLTNVTVATWVLPDSVPGPFGRILRQSDLDALRASARDTIKRPPQPAARPGRVERPPLPAQQLVFAPLQALRPETKYRITIGNIRNIAGIPGGGGSITFETPARLKAPVSPPARDTTAARVKPDSTKH